ncbi:2-deoxystreptamine glucosyltransferase [Rosistilla carotiformis]|uniref:2-deoxystreptamine glucosyltransferase n=2 Tax=Rosistilla carotiformis TaxID=2528017 RepID=A0A518JVG1_9BACT|nr:2-deoxystreptamine glucosyltransferase [Rosistilla carotiformis]
MPAGQGFDRLLEQRGIDCEYRMPSRPAEWSRARKAWGYLRILGRIRTLRPDLIYVNQTGSLPAASVYSRVLRIPIVCQVQTLEDARWLSDRKHLQRSVQAFICNSQYIADQTRIEPAKKCVLYQGMPEARLQRAVENARQLREKRSASSFTIGILGRIAISKGHYLLLDAANHLLANGVDCRFVVIGEGLTPADTQAYRDAVQRAGLADRFEFRGYQTDLEFELGRLDVLAIPSIAEPLGRVLFDAAEHAIPVVVADSGGLGEVAKRFSIGVCFHAEDAKSLATALMQTESDYDQIADRFRAAAVDMFRRLSNKSYIDAVERILQSASSQKSAAVTWIGGA